MGAPLGPKYLPCSYMEPLGREAKSIQDLFDLLQKVLVVPI